jgi:SAM-dependent methyltransferase
MNEDKFTGKAGIYAKYRPAYPDEFIEYLYTHVGLSKDSVIADIGSGTGILTRLLLRRGSVVYAVEPNEDMRGTAERALSQYQRLISVNAPAENTGLKDSGIDFITVAQAFHWFDRERFKSECRRILKAAGKVVLVWNTRDSSSGLVMENDAINQLHCPDFKGFSGGMRGMEPEEYGDFFKDGICEYKVFPNDLILDEAGFIGRNMSASYAPKTGAENYQPYIDALKRLFEKYSSAGTLRMPNLTRSYVGEV